MAWINSVRTRSGKGWLHQTVSGAGVVIGQYAYHARDERGSGAVSGHPTPSGGSAAAYRSGAAELTRNGRGTRDEGLAARFPAIDIVCDRHILSALHRFRCARGLS